MVNDADTKKITLVLQSKEAELIRQRAEEVGISTNQFIKNLLFPSSFDDKIDRKVYESIQSGDKIPKATAIKMSLQKHLDVPFRDEFYVYFERYKYIFIKPKKEDAYYPLCLQVLGRTGMQSIQLAILNRQSIGFKFQDFEFKNFCKFLNVTEHDTKENTYIIEGSTVVEMAYREYKIIAN